MFCYVLAFCLYVFFFFFFKQKTAYEMRISDWSSDVCSSDLAIWLAALPVKPRAVIFDTTIAGIALPWASLLADLAPARLPLVIAMRSRSEERRVGKECVSTCRSRWSPYH